MTDLQQQIHEAHEEMAKVAKDHADGGTLLTMEPHIRRLIRNQVRILAVLDAPEPPEPAVDPQRLLRWMNFWDEHGAGLVALLNKQPQKKGGRPAGVPPAKPKEPQS